MPAHAEPVSDLAFTPDKSKLVTGSRNGEVKVWDLTGRKMVHKIDAHQARVYAIAMSADGKRFATSGQDNVVKVWDTESGKLLREWSFELPGLTNRAFVRALAFTPNGKHLATANSNTTLFLLEVP